MRAPGVPRVRTTVRGLYSDALLSADRDACGLLWPLLHSGSIRACNAALSSLSEKESGIASATHATISAAIRPLQHQQPLQTPLLLRLCPCSAARLAASTS